MKLTRMEGILKHGDVLFELSQERPHYQLPHETYLPFKSRELAQLFRKQELLKDNEMKLKNNLL